MRDKVLRIHSVGPSVVQSSVQQPGQKRLAFQGRRAVEAAPVVLEPLLEWSRFVPGKTVQELLGKGTPYVFASKRPDAFETVYKFMQLPEVKRPNLTFRDQSLVLIAHELPERYKVTEFNVPIRMLYQPGVDKLTINLDKFTFRAGEPAGAAIYLAIVSDHKYPVSRGEYTQLDSGTEVVVQHTRSIGLGAFLDSFRKTANEK